MKCGYPQSLIFNFFFLLFLIVWRIYWERAQMQAAGTIYLELSPSDFLYLQLKKSLPNGGEILRSRSISVHPLV